jgi:hypothetical protein
MLSHGCCWPQSSRGLGVDECCVIALPLRACDSLMSSTVVVQELLGKLRLATVIAVLPRHSLQPSKCNSHPRGRHATRCTCPSDHLKWIVRSDVSGGLYAHWNVFVHLADHLVAMRLIVLDEVSSLPEGVARLAKRLWMQTQLRLDDCANDEAAICQNAVAHTPQSQDVARRSIEDAQVR